MHTAGKKGKGRYRYRYLLISLAGEALGATSLRDLTASVSVIAAAFTQPVGLSK